MLYQLSVNGHALALPHSLRSKTVRALVARQSIDCRLHLDRPINQIIPFRERKLGAGEYIRSIFNVIFKDPLSLTFLYVLRTHRPQGLLAFYRHAFCQESPMHSLTQPLLRLPVVFSLILPRADLAPRFEF